MNPLTDAPAPAAPPTFGLHADVLYGPVAPALLREEILADLLEASARRSPDQVALVYE